jgi:outer membrane lipoprotein-sorting protein
MKLGLCVLGIVIVLLTGELNAQVNSPAEYFNRLIESQKKINEYKVRAVGGFQDTNQKIQFDVRFSGIQSKKLFRQEFSAPETLAENFSVFDQKAQITYFFISNQVVVSQITDIGGVSGLNPSNIASLTTTVNTNELKFEPLKTETVGGEVLTVLELTPKNSKALEWQRLKLWLTSQYQIRRLQMWADNTQADVRLLDWRINTGLKVADLCKLPRDAELIRKDNVKTVSCKL